MRTIQLGLKSVYNMIRNVKSSNIKTLNIHDISPYARLIWLHITALS